MTLREMRESKGMSLSDVERITKLNRGTLSKIERGIELPDPATLVKLSGAYDVDPAGWRTTIAYVWTEPRP